MRKIIRLLQVVFVLSIMLFTVSACDTFEAEHEHTYSTQVVAPTCTDKGYTVYICECGNSFISNFVEVLDHVFDDGTILHDYGKCQIMEYHCITCELKKEEHIGTHEFSLYEVLTENVDGIKKSGKFVCENCGVVKIDTITYDDLSMPILNFIGSLDGISKENKIKLNAEYKDDKNEFNYFATLKLQGASSLGYPKKNYNIQFFKDETYEKKQKIEFVDGWGKESKYCLKANYIDFSQSRNVVSGKLYGEMVKSREIDDEYSKLYNGGAIDGFPIVIYLNDEYLGLYTLNIPKDKWLFDMDEDHGTKEALLMANDWTDSVKLNEKVADDFSNGWELEYCSTEEKEEGTGWVVKSFNDMIDFVSNNIGEDFKSGISTYINIDRAIDSMLLTYMILGGDNVSKNILWATYDGTVWTPSVYDMDGTWGLMWDGQNFYDYSFLSPKSNIGNALWIKLLKNYREEIKIRWQELREGVFSLGNITKTFNDFYEKINPIIIESEKIKWQNIPSMDTNNIDQIIGFARDRLLFLDEEISNLGK